MGVLLHIVVSFTLLQSIFGKQCLDGSECSDDKPFCTPVGCMYTCPAPFYINGTNCVVNCKDRFVNGRECVERCPSHKFLVETLKITGGEPYLETKCTDTCGGSVGDFVFNNTCVHVCPANARFFEDNSLKSFTANQYCLDRCPEDKQLNLEVTLSNVTYYQCQNSCNSESSMFAENGFCVKQCTTGKVSMDNVCIDKCPESHPVLLGSICYKNCENYSDESATDCSCPMETPFLYEKKCIDMCPVDVPFISVISGVKHCSGSCGDNYSSNNTCVNVCPHNQFLYANACLSTCPDDKPFSCKANADSNNCSENQTTEFGQNLCVRECPPNVFTSGTHCTSECDKFLDEKNGSCVDKCPMDLPFSVNLTTALDCYWSSCTTVKVQKQVCVNNCPVDKFALETDCVDFCPETYKLLNRTCVKNCPKYYLLTTKRYTFYTYQNTGVYFSRPWEKNAHSVSGTECVLTCNENQVQFNSSCIDKCPLAQMYNKDGICTDEPCDNYIYNLTTYIKCTNSCNDEYFMYGKTCVERCPDSYIHLFTNKSCVLKCPFSKPFKQKIVIKNNDAQQCVEECDDSRYALVQETSDCVENCPADMRYIVNKACRKSCPENTFLYDSVGGAGIECVRGCPSFTHQYNKTCVSSCPDNFTSNHGVCELFCSSSTVKFNGECLSRCPKGYYVDDINQPVCVAKAGLIVFLAFFILLLLPPSVCCRKVVRDYMSVIFRALCQCKSGSSKMSMFKDLMDCTLDDHDEGRIHFQETNIEQFHFEDSAVDFDQAQPLIEIV